MPRSKEECHENAVASVRAIPDWKILTILEEAKKIKYYEFVFELEKEIKRREKI